MDNQVNGIKSYPLALAMRIEEFLRATAMSSTDSSRIGAEAAKLYREIGWTR